MPGLTVRPKGGGEPLEFRRFGGVNPGYHEGKSRGLIGSLMVPEPGTYVIDAPEPFNEPMQEHFQHFVISTDTKLLFDAAAS